MPRIKPPSPIAPAVIAAIPLSDLPTEEAVVMDADEDVVPYGNPRIPDEQFYVSGSPYRGRFVNGLYMAKRGSVEESSCRAALAAHGPDKPDRWKGRDRKNPWIHKRTGFTAINEAVKEDFEHYHEL